MDTLGKFKTNFLNRKNPFKVGFNNRSPFSYISSTGPAVPSSYDGGVPLVNFTPDQYAQAFDSSEAVKAEGKMYEKAGKAAGQLVSATAGAIAGGIEAGKDPGNTGGKKGGASFKEIMQGASKGFKEKGKEGIIGGLGQGYGDLSPDKEDEEVKFADMTIDNADPVIKQAYFQWKNRGETGMLGNTSYPNQNKTWKDFIDAYGN
tara:strand:+ start:96 stop:707 length:612 start_codon:yes stop_codon:yes gene_type:complete